MIRLLACLLIGLLATCARGQTPSGDPPQPQQPPTVQPVKSQTAAPTSRVSAVAMLRARLPQIAFDETPLADAFVHLAEVTGTSIVWDCSLVWIRIACVKECFAIIKINVIPI